MDFATLLWILTIPGGAPHVMGGFPAPIDDCKSFVHEHLEIGRDRLICVKSPVWVIDHKHWRLIGNKLYYRGNPEPWPVTSRVTAAARQ